MYTIAIHGGAESLTPDSLSPEQQRAYHNGLSDALAAGYAILADGGTALDAVQQAVIHLEDNELFNAGKGAAFTNQQTHELEAAIMCGRTLMAGAVAGISNVRNPIALARAVMDKSGHVFMIGDGANAFAHEQHLLFEPNNYFLAQKSLDEFVQAEEEANEPTNKDTVGAVALDVHGNLAAATSTGGLTFQKVGRVGDSSVIGCGTYANNRTCAVSCTGDGEYFIRAVAAYDVSCLVEYKGLSLHDACQYVIMDKLKQLDGEGGLIAVDTAGHIELVFNSSSMFRAWRNDRGEGETAIFR